LRTGQPLNLICRSDDEAGDRDRSPTTLCAMRVLVTGGAGFIGSHFARRLAAAGEEVVVLDKLTYAGSRANLDGCDAAFLVGDIADPEAVAEAAAGCDAIVNFAAETHVDRSILEGGDFLRTNVSGANVLLEQARGSAARLVHVSTDEVYGDLPPGASSREDDALRPSSPYSAAKAGGDLLVLAHVRTYGVDALITRGSNTYGPNQYPEKILPLFVTNALDGEPLPLYGDGRQVRDWLYVEDHCAGIELALREGSAGEVYNVGGGEEVENREITRRVLELTSADDSLIRRVEDRPGHDRRYSLDTSKLEALGWAKRWTLAEGLPATVAWYRDNRAWWERLKQSEDYRAYYEKQYAARLG
jgi:dTDP-glucose 4,6-dehydratase